MLWPSVTRRSWAGPPGPFPSLSGVRVQYLKHPDTLHWTHDPMVVLGEDAWGLWLAATPDTWFRNHVDKEFAARGPAVQLIVPNAWWTLIRNDGGTYPWYVDIVVPAVVEDGVVTMVDLDLDVVEGADGLAFVDDKDEFEEHRVTLDYPDRWVDQARVTAARILLDLEARRGPFGAVADGWLAEARSLWPHARSPSNH